ncbi:MAG: class I SAM-dependent methyltransferase [Gemmatimonadales bacterium]
MPSGLSPAAVLAILQPWAAVAEPIHRRLAQLVDAEPGQEVLWIGCGTGRSVLWWAQRFQSHVEGVDQDQVAIDAAERAVREAGLFKIATFQTAQPVDLPHESQVFDIVVVQILYLRDADQVRVIQEAARVARPMGVIVGVVPTWLRTPTDSEVRFVQSLGIAPQLLVEWKRFFREASIVELSVEDAAADAGWLAASWVGLLVRGWRAARWAGLRFVLSKPLRVLRRLALHRSLGLSVIRGTRWPHSNEAAGNG